MTSWVSMKQYSVTRRIVVEIKRRITIERWKDTRLMDTLMECLGVTWWIMVDTSCYSKHFNQSYRLC